eukprot:CAMPEP_0115006500 /NCGR_PEP_ID=MMETSP0216-20121206/20544_1 /TAXON_ID=223996 /ORGANISM="Protocruzia adherens, Strain Boccale" /LENGTH=916 /DNA_ID=CAMNT_0002373109 /DNA_START=104 /DNA_END=2854 /DNA_ORIENTATION=+
MPPRRKKDDLDDFLNRELALQTGKTKKKSSALSKASDGPELKPRKKKIDDFIDQEFKKIGGDLKIARKTKKKRDIDDILEKEEEMKRQRELQAEEARIIEEEEAARRRFEQKQKKEQRKMDLENKFYKAPMNEEDAERERKLQRKREKEARARQEEEERKQKEKEQRDRKRQQPKGGLGDDSEDTYSSASFDDYPDDDFEVEEPKGTKSKTSKSSASRNVVDPMSDLLGAINEENKVAIEKTRAITPNKALGAMDSDDSSDDDYSAFTSKKGKKGPLDKRGIVQISSSSGGDVVVDFKTRERQEKRLAKLQGKIDLQQDYFDMLDIMPTSKLDFHHIKLSNGLAHNTKVQTNDDCREVDIQTDDWDTADQCSQWPDDRYRNVSSTAEKRRIAKEDPVSLNRFLTKVGPVFEALLAENWAGNSKVDTQSNDRESISDRVDFAFPQTMIDDETKIFPTAICFFKVDSDQTAVAYSVVPRESAETRHFIIIWNSQKKQPFKVLISESQIQTLTVPRNTHNLLFAGTVDGSVLVWDLRESDATHKNLNNKNFFMGLKKNYETIFETLPEGAFRRPSYSSDGIYLDSHMCTVMKIVDVERQGSEGSKLTQIVSIDDFGGIISWQIIESAEGDLSGSEADLGVGIGSRIKLTKNVTIDMKSLYDGNDLMNYSDVVVDRGNLNSIIYASTNGLYQGSRFGELANVAPKHYDLSASLGLQANSISVHCSSVKEFFARERTNKSRQPFTFFLVGFSSGAVSIYDKNFSNPISTWHDASEHGIKFVQWALNADEFDLRYLMQTFTDKTLRMQTLQSIDLSLLATFITVDTRDILSVWDLSRDIQKPLFTVDLRERCGSPEGFYSFKMVLNLRSKKILVACSLKNGVVKILDLSLVKRPTKTKSISSELERFRRLVMSLPSVDTKLD